MNLTVGKDYKTRGGWKARCVYEEVGKLLFVHTRSGCGQSEWHWRDGIAWGSIEGYNIQSEWVEPSPPLVFDRWLNVYDCGLGDVYPEKAVAGLSALPSRLDCVHIRYDSSAPPDKRIVTVVDKEEIA